MPYGILLMQGVHAYMIIDNWIELSAQSVILAVIVGCVIDIWRTKRKREKK